MNSKYQNVIMLIQSYNNPKKPLLCLYDFMLCVLISTSSKKKKKKNVLTCKQTSDETSCSNVPRDMTGNEVKITLNNTMYQAL